MEAQYIIPDLPDDSVIGKAETLTIAGKTVSSPLHTLKIEKNYGKYTVTGYYSIPSDGNPRIPAYITAIGNYAFSDCADLTEVTLPASLTSIGEQAFRGCAKLERADLSGCTSLTSIGAEAFSGCSGLTSAIFADTAGWAVYNDDNCKNKHADIQATDLQNPATAAVYLHTTYSWKYWKKN